MKKGLALATQILLFTLLLFVLFCVAALYLWPAVQDAFGDFYSAKWGKAGMFAFLTAAGLMACHILAELLLVMRTVQGDPFVQRNVYAFSRMGATAELAGLLFLIKSILDFTPMTAVCALVMLLSGLFALVMAEVFKRAVDFKQENDLTI
ncbi:MAG TPA: DUF2975 domain-containing protein [Clostridia bacterium]|nr:DUF2975 domain-containing protein [Clostridia bacterium]